jgi:hypothetical protein
MNGGTVESFDKGPHGGMRAALGRYHEIVMLFRNRDER